jgi:hypothetical protein
MSHRLLKLAAQAFAVATIPAATLIAAASAAPPQLPVCTLSGVGHIQICPTSFKATAGKSSQVVVARYADFSHCDLPNPENEPGENQNYVVASVTINWGDHTRPTSGVAHTGTTCVPSDGPDTNPGIAEPITGVHRYKRRGTYRVSVSITYVRGPGNTYQNCASTSPGDTTYNNLTNCIALGAPVSSLGTIRK